MRNKLDAFHRTKASSIEETFRQSMNPQEHDYEIRYLTEDDSEDIIEISGLTWDGYDYLAHIFRKWFDDVNSHTVGIIIDDHVAALANLRIIDNGLTGWMEGLRVHPKHRGKGLASILTQYVANLAIEKNIARLRYTTASDNETSIHLAQSIGMEIKHRMGIFWNNELDKIDWRKKGPIHEIDTKDLADSLTNFDLFPYDIIIHDWKAYDASKEILLKLGNDARFFVGKEGKEIVSLSIGNRRWEGDSEFWGITIYAKNEEHCFAHLSYHLDIASNEYEGIFVIFPEQFSSKMAELEWTLATHDRSKRVMRILLLERIL